MAEVSDTSTLTVGKVSGVYGVKGWLKIHSFTQPMQNLLDYDDFLLKQSGRWQALKFDQLRVHGKAIIGHIDGIDDRDQAKVFVGCELAIDSGALPELDADEYYWHQLIGLVVYSEFDGRRVRLGRVQGLLETGANDVLQLRGDEQSIDQRERLVPWVPGQYVKQVDLVGGEVLVDWDPEF